MMRINLFKPLGISLILNILFLGSAYSATLLEKVEQDTSQYFEMVSCDNPLKGQLSQSDQYFQPNSDDENGARVDIYTLNLEVGMAAFIEVSSPDFQPSVVIDVLIPDKRNRYFSIFRASSTAGGISYIHKNGSIKKGKDVSRVKLYIQSQALNQLGSYDMRVVIAKPTSSLSSDDISDINLSHLNDFLEGNLGETFQPGLYVKRYINALCSQ